MTRCRVLIVLLACAASAGFAQTESIPPERLAARTAFQDARFGMFVHWGVRVPTGGGRVVRAETFMDHTPVKFVIAEADITLYVPPRAAGEVDQVIVLTLSSRDR